MSDEKSTSNAAAPAKQETTAEAIADGVEQTTQDDKASSLPSTANAGIPKSPPKPVPQTAATSAAAKPAAVQKPVATKPATPPPRFEPQPSLPVSMIVKPHSTADVNGSSLFPGELSESFETAISRVQFLRSRNSWARRVLRHIRKLMWDSKTPEPVEIQRLVAFDGFYNDMFEDKRERDRRYGTVYSVGEEANAFLVRLELPRRMPTSSLKTTWELPDVMPDYVCNLELADNVLSIRAGLPDESRRRVSYVSPSFPSDFQTRIVFDAPVEGFKHRLSDKVLEIIVFKKARLGPDNSARTER